MELMEKNLQLRIGSILTQHEHPRLFIISMTLTIGDTGVYRHASMRVEFSPWYNQVIVIRDVTDDCLHQLEVPCNGQATCAACPD
mmetsp:Transcript_9550/g.25587  ORF Transcript_9550/g.25587 Transcript_9550/m.25587 type:complete len:85 (+) Transcript_9550:257-511(+)